MKRERGEICGLGKREKKDAASRFMNEQPSANGCA